MNALLGPQQYFEGFMSFRDFSWRIERQSAGRLVALASSVLGPHNWLKTGLYTSAGAETSQTNGNAQILYRYLLLVPSVYFYLFQFYQRSCEAVWCRLGGASIMFFAGTLWYGQVSIYNWFGVKVPSTFLFQIL